MRACWYRCRVPLHNASSGCCCQSAGVAAGGGCGMSMAVWTLGPDGDDIDAVAKKKARAWLPPKTYVVIWGLCWRIVFGLEHKSGKNLSSNILHFLHGPHGFSFLHSCSVPELVKVRKSAECRLNVGW